MRRFKNRVAIVMGCGDGSGIGSTVSKLLASEGASVVCVDSKRESADALVQQIRSSGGEATACCADVADETASISAVSIAEEKYGCVDHLHFNAAAQGPSGAIAELVGTVVDLPLSVLDQAWAVNARGFVLALRAVVPRMLDRGGSIVYTSSALGTLATGNLGAYGATKACANALCRHIATAYGKRGIRINAVAPGRVLPKASDALTSDTESLLLRHHLTPRVGEPSDVAKMIVYLLSQDADFVTGQTIHVDGGLDCHQPYYVDDPTQAVFRQSPIGIPKPPRP